jgi:hypothetical protein
LSEEAVTAEKFEPELRIGGEMVTGNAYDYLLKKCKNQLSPLRTPLASRV